MSASGFIYIKITDVLPEFRSVPGVEKFIGLVKLGKTNNLARRDKDYKIYRPMLFHTVFAVHVDDRHVAEQLVLEHFRPHNVRREVDASAQRTMSPELAEIAKQVGVECFRIDREAAETVLRLIGDTVAPVIKASLSRAAAAAIPGARARALHPGEIVDADQ